MISSFCGLVGAIGEQESKRKPNTGVAIAPLLCLLIQQDTECNGQHEILFGAIYLYSINCVFICISTFSSLISKQKEGFKRAKRVKHYSTLITILILPIFTLSINSAKITSIKLMYLLKPNSLVKECYFIQKNKV
jgi:hypothetical protein